MKTYAKKFSVIVMIDLFITYVMSKLNYIIPLCGKGERFFDHGYQMIKPMIKVGGRCIIDWLLDRLGSDVIWIIINDNVESYGFSNHMQCRKNVNVINIHQYTSGACETVKIGLDAIKRINPDISGGVVCLDGDGFYTFDIKERYFNKMGGVQNGLFCFEEKIKTCYSFVEVDDTMQIKTIKEKVKISNLANCGAYMFKDVDQLYSILCNVLSEPHSTEMFLSRCIDRLIQMGEKVHCEIIDKKQFVSLGTPLQVREFYNDVVNLLFDLDGTIVQTDHIYFDVWKKILHRYGIDIDAKYYEQYIFGNADKTVLQHINIDLQLEELSILKDRLFIEMIDRVVPIKGAVEFIRQMWWDGHGIAIVSNGNKQTVHAVLKRLQIEKYIDCVVCAGTASNPKPYPDPYLCAIKHFNNNKKNICFEDSKTGMLSASTAGAGYLIGVCCKDDCKQMFNLDMVIDRYDGLDVKKIIAIKHTDNIELKNMIYEQFDQFEQVKDITIYGEKLKGGYIGDVIAVDVSTEDRIYKTVVKMRGIGEGIMQTMAKELQLFETECHFYESVSKYCHLKCPRLHTILRDPVSFEAKGIMIERIDGVIGKDLNGCVDTMYRVVDDLAKMHKSTMNLNLKEKFGMRRSTDNIFWSRFVKQNINEWIERWKGVVDERMCDFMINACKKFDDVMLKNAQGMLCLCHGDFKSPNIVYGKYMNTYLDWQYTFEGKGLGDLVFMIMESLDEHNIKKHFWDLIHRYVGEDKVEKDDLITVLSYFPVLVAVWFGCVRSEDLIDNEFPYRFIKRFETIINLL